MEYTIISNDPVKALNRIYQLKKRMWRIVLLYYCFCGMNCREIAAELGETTRTILQVRKAALEELEHESS